jgi:hypothetical protein
MKESYIENMKTFYPYKIEDKDIFPSDHGYQVAEIKFGNHKVKVATWNTLKQCNYNYNNKRTNNPFDISETDDEFFARFDLIIDTIEKKLNDCDVIMLQEFTGNKSTNDKLSKKINALCTTKGLNSCKHQDLTILYKKSSFTFVSQANLFGTKPNTKRLEVNLQHINSKQNMAFYNFHIDYTHDQDSIINDIEHIISNKKGQIVIIGGDTNHDSTFFDTFHDNKNIKILANDQATTFSKLNKGFTCNDHRTRNNKNYDLFIVANNSKAQITSALSNGIIFKEQNEIINIEEIIFKKQDVIINIEEIIFKEQNEITSNNSSSLEPLKYTPITSNNFSFLKLGAFVANSIPLLASLATLITAQILKFNFNLISDVAYKAMTGVGGALTGLFSLTGAGMYFGFLVDNYKKTNHAAKEGYNIKYNNPVINFIMAPISTAEVKYTQLVEDNTTKNKSI